MNEVRRILRPREHEHPWMFLALLSPQVVALIAVAARFLA